ncbi:MAG TPA: hypothetical protein VLC28_09845 [Flavitalea sp.]|nr:hypothetical protein [Flavitalea sp.]
MAKKKNKKNHLTKQGARDQVVNALETSLGDLRIALGDKKFNKRVKQASRLLTDGLPKTDKSSKPNVKKIVLDLPTEGGVKSNM